MIVPLLAALAAGVICHFAPAIASKFKVMDVPDRARKSHAQPTPLIGGLAAVAPFVVAALLWAYFSGFWRTSLSLAFVGAGFWLLGYLDDRRHIVPVRRLLVSIALCFGVIAAVPEQRVTYFVFGFLDDNIFLFGWSGLFTMFCLVGLQNAVNMADGRNGLVAGMSLIWCLAMLPYAPPDLLLLLLVLIATLAVTFYYNMRGRLFLGDSGAYSLAVVVGLMAIYTYGVNYGALKAEVVALWFLIPVVDCLRAMITRLLAGQSPFEANRDHLHYVLEDMVSWPLGLVIYLALIAIPALISAIWADLALMAGVLTLVVYTAIYLSRVEASLQQQTAG